MTQIIGSNGIRVKAKTIVFDNIVYMSKSEIDVQITNFFIDNQIDNATYIEEVYSVTSPLENNLSIGTIDNLFYDIKIEENSIYTDYLARELVSALDTNLIPTGQGEFMIPMLEKIIQRRHRGYFDRSAKVSYDEQKQVYSKLIEDFVIYGSDAEVVQSARDKIRFFGDDSRVDVVIAASEYVQDNLSDFTFGTKQINRKMVEEVVVPSVLLSDTPRDFIQRINKINQNDGDYIVQSNQYVLIRKIDDYIQESTPLFQGTLDTVLGSSTLLESIDNYIQTDANIIEDIQSYLQRDSLLVTQTNFDYQRRKELIMSAETGLITISNTDKATYNRPMEIGPPDKSFVTINGLHRFSPIHKVPDYTVGPDDITVETKFQFEKLNEYEINLDVYVKQEVEKTFLHKLFYVEIDDLVRNYNMVPAVTEQSYSHFINDESYVQLKTKSTDTSIFKFRMDEVVYKPSYYLLDPTFIVFGKHSDSFGGFASYIDNIPFYLFDNFNGSHNRNNRKTVTISPVKIRSSETRRKGGGSDAYGHYVTAIPRQIEGHKIVPMNFIKNQQYSIYTDKYIVNFDIGSDEKIYEFDNFEFNLSTGKEHTGPIDGAKYIWNYELVSDNRLIECLAITPTGTIAGRIDEMDVFLNRYSFERWVKDEGHHPPQDTNWLDFEMETPRVFDYDILGISVSQGIIEVIDDGNEPAIGSFVEQINSTTGIVSRGEIISRTLIEDPVAVILAQGTQPVLRQIYQLGIRVVEGYQFDFEFYNESTDYDVTPIQAELAAIARRNELQTQLATETDPVIIANLQEQIAILDVKITQLSGTTFLAVENVTQTVTPRYLNIDGVQYFVYSFEVDGSSGLRKEINLSLEINNNFSFDRDFWLHANRDDEYIKQIREEGFGRYSYASNAAEMDKLITSFDEKLKSGEVTEQEHELQVREYQTAKGGTEDAQYERLENIEPFRIACNIPVESERIYYETVTDVLIETRGHGSYANCK